MKLEFSLSRNIVLLRIILWEADLMFSKKSSSFTLLGFNKFCLFHIQKTGKIIYIQFLYKQFNNIKRSIRKKINDK